MSSENNLDAVQFSFPHTGPPLAANIDTAMLGGVQHPSHETLRAMDDSDYILHARDGKLSEVPAEKVLLPHDPDVSPQTAGVKLSPEGAIFARLRNLICKSVDGGRSWASHNQGSYKGGKRPEKFAVLSNGAFIGLCSEFESDDPIDVVISHNEGRTWEKMSEIKLPAIYRMRVVFAFTCLVDDVLVVAIDVLVRDWCGSVLCYRSEDGGNTWEGPRTMVGWGSEGGFAHMASGKLMATIRYQTQDMKYKNVSIADSFDRGKTWHNWRLLTSVMGQAYGYPAALSDGSVVVVHDTRYGPGSPGARALVSYDEGATWANEVYYLDITTYVGAYAPSVVLEDNTIVTVSGTCDKGNTHKDTRGNTDNHAIRWKLKK